MRYNLNCEGECIIVYLFGIVNETFSDFPVQVQGYFYTTYQKVYASKSMMCAFY